MSLVPIDGKFSNNSYTSSSAGVSGISTVGYRTLGEGVFYAEIITLDTISSQKSVAVTETLDRAWVASGLFTDTMLTIPYITNAPIGTVYGILLDLSGNIGKVCYNINGGDFSQWVDCLAPATNAPLSIFRLAFIGSTSASGTLFVRVNYTATLTSLLKVRQLVGKEVYYYESGDMIDFDAMLMESNGSLISINSSQLSQYEFNMTANNAPIPYVATASSEYSTAYAAWKAFNGTNTGVGDAWITVNGTRTGWLKIDVGSDILVNLISITNRLNTPGIAPKKFTFSGSVDDLNYTRLLSVENSTGWTEGETRSFDFTNLKKYRYFKFDLLENDGYANYSGLANLNLFDNSTALTYYNDYTLDTIINNGVSKINKISKYINRTDYKLTNLNISTSEIDIYTQPHLLSCDDKMIIYKNSKYYGLINNVLSEVSDSNFSLYGFNSYEFSNLEMVQIPVPFSVIIDTSAVINTEVSNNHETLSLSNLMNNSLKVVNYSTRNNSNLKITNNSTRLNYLSGDFDLLTYSKSNLDTVTLTESVPINQFIKFKEPLSVGVNFTGINIIESSPDISINKYLISPDNINWFKWNGIDFVPINVSTNDDVLLGNSLFEISSANFKEKWNYNTISIGVLLVTDKSGALISNVKEITLELSIDKFSPKISKLEFYILNTTATIDIQLDGLTIKGTLSDDDSTRVQYRVILNNRYYYPTNGDFTPLASPPQSIDITMSSNDIKINDWNDLTVEFKDYFGTVDSWQVQFLGEYSGLMFRTTDGQYYSSDIGKVLQYLDFGLIVSGQTTVEHTIVLKNELGYTVEDVLLALNLNRIPSGVIVEFSPHAINEWSPSLNLAPSMVDDEEIMFDIRMRTDINASPNPNGIFDIFVSATKQQN